MHSAANVTPEEKRAFSAFRNARMYDAACKSGFARVFMRNKSAFFFLFLLAYRLLAWINHTSTVKDVLLNNFASYEASASNAMVEAHTMILSAWKWFRGLGLSVFVNEGCPIGFATCAAFYVPLHFVKVAGRCALGTLQESGSTDDFS